MKLRFLPLVASFVDRPFPSPRWMAMHQTTQLTRPPLFDVKRRLDCSPPLPSTPPPPSSPPITTRTPLPSNEMRLGSTHRHQCYPTRVNHLERFQSSCSAFYLHYGPQNILRLYKVGYMIKGPRGETSRLPPE